MCRLTSAMLSAPLTCNEFADLGQTTLVLRLSTKLMWGITMGKLDAQHVLPLGGASGLLYDDYVEEHIINFRVVSSWHVQAHRGWNADRTPRVD